MLTHSIPQFQGFQIKAAYFEDVKNGELLRQQVASMPFAMIDAACICSLEQLFCAVHKALLEYTYNRLRTKNLNSECILSLSPTSNIGEAFKRFGIKETTTNIICLAITEGKESGVIEGTEHVLFQGVEGEEIELSDGTLGSRADVEIIKKVRLNRAT
ncbi:LADA_0G07822g1_1 [Lachancea dasiensis]|uniref:EKC/KEOPS complex subunit CGI121 n=1 Tax=Lachancea dasiensis TaxID=1072105 RepID=A0A1G4JTY2_9SACH|nr:LADA_0G07822g1_1 [Lachancea dasiensis]